MIGRKTLSRLETMLEDAIDGTFQESDYDESVLSRIECKWKRFLGASAFSREAVEREKNYVKEFVSDISHQTKTPMANIRLYTELLREGLTAPGGESGENGEQNLRLLQEIEKQTEKLEFLIQSLTKLSRLESNIVEVKSRGAFTITVCKKGTEFNEGVMDEIIEVPVLEDILMPMVTVVPLQLVAYYTTVLKGLNVDKPRNLAKSVTVE